MTAIKLPRDQENDIVEALLRRLTERPEVWSDGVYTFDWTPPPVKTGNTWDDALQDLDSLLNRVGLWTANGFAGFRLQSPCRMRFRLKNKWRLWRAVKAVRALKAAERFAKQSEAIRTALSVPTPEPDVLDATEIAYTPEGWMQ